MRSFSAVAFGLSLAHLTSARVANALFDLHRRDAGSESSNPLANWFSKLYKKATAATCYQDEYYTFVTNSSFGQEFCQALISYPNTTLTVTSTPRSTSYDIYSTTYVATSSDVTTIPESTATVTVTTQSSGNAKRDVAPVPTPAPRSPSALEIVEAGLEMFRRQNEGDETSVGTLILSASLSSACSCQPYAGQVVTTTRTAPAVIVTRSAFEQETITTSGTVTAGTTTTYTTVTPSADAVSTEKPVAQPPSSSISSSEGPAPTAPGFQCPEDNSTTVSQLVGPERYDYLVLCDTDITDEEFYGVLSYSSFSECAAACSVANQRFDTPLCQGFSYYDTPTGAGYNCFLKSTANSTVSAIGVDSGILQIIAVGLDDANPSGTNTESGPFAASIINPNDASSALSQILTGSSTSISVVTPGPVFPASGLLVNAAGQTLYSTYISDGSTYSYRTGFSTYVSTNGSWYSYYYTSFTQSWASATTVYASSETSTTVSNSSSSGTNVQSGGPNGEYWTITTTNVTTYFPGGYNVSQIVANETHAANGTEIGAATTTYYYTFSTGGAGSGFDSGSENGLSSASAGLITSGTAWSSSYSTQTVIPGGGVASGGAGGGGAGGEGGGVASTAPLTLSPSVIINTFGTAYSSGYVISGQAGGNSGASSIEASGAILSSATVISSGAGFTPISATSGATGVGGAFSIFASGVVPSSGASFTPISSTSGGSGIGGTSSTFDSGVVFSSGVPFTSISSTSGVTGTGGVSSGFGSGAIPSSGAPFTPISSTSFGTGIGGASSTFDFGVIPSSGAPLPSISSTRVGTGIGGESSTAASGSRPFSNSNNNRSNSLSTATPFSSWVTPASSSLPTVPANSTAPVPSGTGPSSAPFSAPTGTAPTGTAPIGTGPQSSSVPFSQPSNPRSGTLSSISAPSGTAPLGTASPATAPLGTSLSDITFTESIPVGTGPISYYPFGASSGIRSGLLPPSGSAPSGTAPVVISPIGTAPIYTGPGSSGTAPVYTGPASSSTAPYGTASTGSVPYSAPSGPRSGSLPPSGTAPDTSPIYPTGTSPTTPLFPTGTSPTSCVTNFLGTTTIFTTVTEFGCYSNCPPAGFGGYGESPLNFGPPAQSQGAYYGPGGGRGGK